VHRLQIRPKQLEGTLIILPTHIRVRAVVWECGEGQTDRHAQTRVTSIHFASAMPHAKCSYFTWPLVSNAGVTLSDVLLILCGRSVRYVAGLCVHVYTRGYIRYAVDYLPHWPRMRPGHSSPRLQGIRHSASTSWHWLWPITGTAETWKRGVRY